jgi:hypothetical protein
LFIVAGIALLAYLIMNAAMEDAWIRARRISDDDVADWEDDLERDRRNPR